MLRDYSVFSLLPARFPLIFSLCTIRTLVPIFQTCRFQFPSCIVASQRLWGGGAKNVLPYEGGNSISINLLYVGKDSVGLPIKQAGLG